MTKKKPHCLECKSQRLVKTKTKHPDYPGNHDLTWCPDCGTLIAVVFEKPRW